MKKNTGIDYVTDGSITYFYLRNNQELIVTLQGKEKGFVSLYADNDILRVTDIDKKDINTPYKERERQKALKTYNHMVKQREDQKKNNK